MHIIYKILLALMVVLAVSSGIMKIMLMQQEVDFFSGYGFSNPLLIAFGAVQVIAGLMIILPVTRFWGALIVYVTFTISAFILVLADSRVLVMVSLAVICLLGVVMRKTRNDGHVAF